METQEHKNWLNTDFHQYLKDTFLFNTPHYWGHSSNPGDSNFFYSTNLNIFDSMSQFLISKLLKTIDKKVDVERMYLNIQHPGMNGNYHIDSCDFTAVYMVCGNGDLQILKEKDYVFEENKLIIFKSNKSHRGLAPDRNVRISLAFKLKERKNS